MSGYGMVVPLLPVYGERIGASAWELGILVAAFFCGRAIGQLPSGSLADRLGRRPAILTAIAGYTICAALFAMAQIPIYLIIARALQGLSAAMFTVSVRALISDLTPVPDRGFAHGLLSSGVNSGFIIGPVCGAILVAAYDIRTPFLCLTAICAVAFIPILRLRRKQRMTFSVRIETKKEISGISRKIPLIYLGISNFFFMAALGIAMTLFPIFGEKFVDGGLTFVSAAFSIAAVCGFFASPIAGRISDILGRVPLIIFGALLLVVEPLSVIFSTSPVVIGIAYGLGGIGTTSYFNSMHAAVADFFGGHERGRAAGFVGLCSDAGGIAGSLGSAAMWQFFSLRTAFVIEAVLLMLMALFVYIVKKRLTIEKVLPAITRESMPAG